MRILSPIVAVLIAGRLISFASAQEPAAQDQQATEPAPGGQQAAQGEPPPHPFDCTFTEAQLCQANLGCEPAETLGDAPLPARFLIHFEKRIVASTDASGLPHVSTIGVLAKTEGNLILQGVSGATGWTIQGSTSDEMVSFTVASNHTTLNAFGTCSAME